MMREKFDSHVLVHRDVRRRNIDFYLAGKKGTNNETEMVPVFYDLKSVRSFLEIEDSEWIEKAMMQLYIEEEL